MSSREFWYDWMGANDVLFFGINSIHGEHYDKVMKVVSWIGEPVRLPFYVSAIAAWVLLALLGKMVRNKKGIMYYLSSWAGVLIMLGVGFAANYVVVNTLKESFAMPRPQIAYATPKVIDTAKDFKKLETNYVIKKYSLEDVRVMERLKESELNKSFPSNHVAFAILVVVALWPVMSSGMMGIGVIFVLLMGWSRIAMGVHFPADVLGTIVIIAPILMILRAMLYSVLFKLFGLRC